MRQANLILVAIAILFGACKSRNHGASTAAFKKEIPTYLGGQVDVFYQSATIYDLQVNWDGKTETILSKKIRQVTPKSGWPTFSKKLLDLQIVTLPNQDDVEGYISYILQPFLFRMSGFITRIPPAKKIQ